MSYKQYPIGGYAPGSYQNKCCDCGEMFFGDKRAVQCEPCAIKAIHPSESAGAYTKDQIRSAIWQELRESNYTGENNERVYEIIGIVLAGLDRIKTPPESAVNAVWVKAGDRLPEPNKHVPIKIGNQFYGAYYNKEHKMIYSLLTHHYWPTSDLDILTNIRWLDESATTAQGNDALRETIEDILLKTGKHNQEQCSEIADAILQDIPNGAQSGKEYSWGAR